jgi:hypothetical protein
MTRNSKGEYDVPDMYDIAGGAMWSNKVDNILVVNRPYYISDPANTQVDIHVRKIKKQKLVGVPGVCALDYSRKTNRYTEDSESPFEKNISVQGELIPQEAQLKPNVNFEKEAPTRIAEPKQITEDPF